MAAPASSLPPGVHNVHHPNMVVPSMQHVSHAPHRVVSAPPATSTAMLPPNRVAPSNIAPHDSHDLRGRIVEVLSATANGCITELGYWPGMPKRLAEMEQVTKQWQTENVKLYQDNQSLVRTVQSLKEQLQLAAAPDSQRLNKIRQLEGHIQQLAHEKQDLIHRNETLVASVANATQNASQQDMVPVSEYNALMEKCRGLHAENQILRGHLARSGYMVHTPQPSPTVPQQGTPVFISNSPMPPPNQMYVQGPMYTQSRPPPRPHHRTSQSGPVPPPVTIPHPQQPIAYTYTQAGPSPPGHQMISPVMAVNPQAFLGGGFPPSYQYVNGPAGMSRRRIASVSGMPGEPGLPTPPPTAHSPTHFGSSLSGALINVDQKPTAPLTPSASASPVSSGVQPIATHSRKSSLSRESMPHISGQANGEMDVDSLKRSMSTALSNDTTMITEEARKKPRIEADVAPMAEVQVSTQQLEPPPAPQEQTQANNAINPQNGVASQDPGSEDEDEDEVPLGPDGLRLVSDCLAELTSDGSDGVEEGICLLCSARVKLGITTETPTSLSGLSEDEAVQHFLEQHKVPWEKVRHDI